MADNGEGPVVERGDDSKNFEISSPRLIRTIRLDPIELESLTWQTTDTFTKFLETPFGTER